jgi:hypothetical protein
MKEQQLTLSGKWKAELNDKRFRTILFLSLLLLAALLYFLTSFLNYAEARPGVILPDPLLEYFTAIDLTWIIFAVIYTSLITAVISLLPEPRQLLFAIQLYAIMVLVRIIAMFLLPLEPPSGIIILQDPLVEFFGSGATLTKDLFFSGHTASILIFFLTARKKIFRTAFLLLTILIGVLVVLQKVHYVIDVYAAVFFTLSSFFIVSRLKSRYNI